MGLVIFEVGDIVTFGEDLDHYYRVKKLGPDPGDALGTTFVPIDPREARFELAWSDIKSDVFDDRFRRLWLYYLAYCQAGFRTGRVDVGHFVLTK